MGDQSGIQWTNATWNPLVGCSRVSEGCRHCYAEVTSARASAMGISRYDGLTTGFGAKARWTGEVRLVESALALPLRWKKPRRIFVNAMSDLFHEGVPDEWIDRIFAVMALCPQHTFQVLTKRPDEMRSYMTAFDPRAAVDALLAEHHPTAEVTTWPLPNVHLGVSVENQAAADERIPLLLQTPAAVRWISYEPALGPVDFSPWLAHRESCGYRLYGEPAICTCPRPPLDWIVGGGESGPSSRPCDLAWIRSVVAQCKAADVPCFVKQLGARPFDSEWYERVYGGAGMRRPTTDAQRAECTLRLRDRKGGDMSEWPEDLRVREFPHA